MRPPLSSAYAPSMADSLPNINFGFDELRDRMTKFTVRFDDFIEKGRKRVLEERNQFRMNVAELHEDQRMKKKDIEILTLKSSTHAQTLQKEAQETHEMHAAIASITSQRDSRAHTRDRLRSQITETQKAISQRLDAQSQHARHIDSQARFNVPELDFWHDYLCLRIEGAGVEDRLKFVYTHVDDRDWEKEAWFELGMGRRDYEVLHVRPKVEGEAVDRVLEKLNETRDLGAFLKGMRELFVEASK
ncbi:MAG: kinetochore-associated Ndc80 complex subunit spc25 [Pycnora praestabilis]|nr:MAG: kinetochore-associated Ndc80 complex subunit spc25 [Pycnora praestabilis]